MDKKKYYVSVQSRSILSEQGHDAYELEIEATEDEVHQLRILFDMLEEADHATFFRGITPGLPYHHDPQNDEYDHLLKDCYEKISQLGTEETKYYVQPMLDSFT